MKIRFLALLLLTLPAACHHRLPDLPGQEVSPGPLVQALDAQRHKLVTVKAVARVETERKGRRRSYESVAIVMNSSGKLRVDGFGPLGESLFALLSDGRTVLLRPPGEEEFISVGQAGLERALGVSLSPGELCAALGGNVIAPQTEVPVRAACETAGRCMVQFSEGGAVRRVHVFRPSGEPADRGLADSEERYDGDRLVYRGRFEGRRSISGYSFPMTVVLENPDRALRLTVLYEEVEINGPVEETIFQGDMQ
ncbi:MAG: DUF4292 domain-containing protein [Nitrospirota bacterium]|nr:DUF4292 domain-containing protein [Nitrospirota bacterium]